MKDLMKYGKAKGIVLLQKYLPQISPFKSVDIVFTCEWRYVTVLRQQKVSEKEVNE